MDFKIVKDTDDKRYIYLKDIKLEQNLMAFYCISDKKILILDKDKKDYTGKEYTRNVTMNMKENNKKDFGIVQEIDAQTLLEISETLIKVMYAYE